MDPWTGYQVYKDAGIAALFIILYLTTIVMFVRALIAHATEQKKITEQVTAAVVQVTRVCDDYRKVCENLQRTMEQKIAQDCEFMAFLRGRDSWKNGKG